MTVERFFDVVSPETLICFHNPCHHGGKCVENPTAPCVCEKGYIGTYCESKLKGKRGKINYELRLHTQLI